MIRICFLHGFAAGGAIWEPYRNTFPDAHMPYLRFAIDGTPFLPEITEPTVLVGWSLGGMVALEMAARFSNLVKGIVLVSSAPSFVASDLFPEGKPRSVLHEMRDGIVRGDPRTLQTFQRQLFTAEEIRQGHLARFRREIGPLIEKAMLTGEMATANLLAQLAFLERWRALPHRYFIPITVVHGTSDAVIDCAAVSAWKRLFPHATITTVEGGHAIPFVHHQLLILTITEILSHAKA